MKKVIVVDLDGTLIKTDLLFESLLVYLKKNPWLIFKVIYLLFTNVSKLKHIVATNVDINPEFLPYRQDILTYLKSSEHDLVLATASSQIYADAVGKHLGIFSRVMGSSETLNLKGKNKLVELKKYYPEFSYIGDSSADLPIWNESKSILCANAKIAKKVKNPEHVFTDKPLSLKTYLKTLRVTQWVKNVLIFVPFFMAHQIMTPEVIKEVILAFLSFSLTASTVYIINDLLDLDSDRRHIFKKFRPLASGAISIPRAVVIACLCFISGVLLAFQVNQPFVAILAIYFLITTLYSFHLKSIVILDILTLAGLYTIRIIAGGAATETYLSPWLLLFSMFLFLGLASIKRYSELIRARKDGKNKVHGRGYLPDDAELVSQMGTTSSYLSVLVLALYINSDAVTKIYSNVIALWFLCPIMLYWLTRLWLLAHRKSLLEDPIVFALRDRVSLLVGFASILIILMAH